MTDKHCTEHQLDLFLKTPGDLTEKEHKEIRAHVSQCKLCEEHLATLQAFYVDLETRLQQPATLRDRLFAETLLNRKSTRLLPFRAVLKKRLEPLLDKARLEIEPYRRPLPQRIMRYLMVRPMRVAGASTLVALALLAAFFVVRPGRQDSPSHARIKDHVLSVYNSKGEVLWTRSVLGIPDVDSERPFSIAGEGRRVLAVTDIDGDEINEVLLTGVMEQSSWARDTLYCFDEAGNLRWKHGVRPVIAFGEMAYTRHARWLIVDFFTVPSTEEGNDRLFVVANAPPYFAAKLFEISPLDGRERQSYWHAGHFNSALTFDVDLDGKQEIILGGTNNAYGRACLAVLDPLQIDGYGRATPEFTPEDLSQAQEKYYLLLPLTRLGQVFGTSPYNVVKELTLNQDGTFTAYTIETPGMQVEMRVGVLYTVTSGMKVVAAIGGDPFFKLHARLVQEGKLQEQLGPVYWEELKNSVLYWDGERLVNEPTGNRLYSVLESLP